MIATTLRRVVLIALTAVTLGLTPQSGAIAKSGLDVPHSRARRVLKPTRPKAGHVTEGWHHIYPAFPSGKISGNTNGDIRIGGPQSRVLAK